MSAAFKAHWKQFLWIWLFPFAFFSSVFVPAYSAHPLAFFVVVDAPVFFICSWFASKPVRQRSVTIGQGVAFTILVPVLLWTLLIYGTFGLALLTGAGGQGH